MTAFFKHGFQVERLWSRAKYILTDERMGMMEPQLFESLLFLKLNKEYWGIEELAEADCARFHEEEDEEEAVDDAGGNGGGGEDSE